MPSLCVLIPYYNGGSSFLSSLRSMESNSNILDVVVVDDGSKDIPAATVLDNYRGSLRIKLIVLESNCGIEHALNAGLAYCVNSYTYIARLDCGDLATETRFILQKDYLEKNSSCVLVGGGAEYATINGKKLFTLKPPTKSEDIRRYIHINAPFIHPSVMFRAAVFRTVGFYPTDYKAAEDLALYFNIVPFYETANLPDIVIRYIVDPNGISAVSRERQIRSRIELLKKHFFLGWYPIYGLLRSYMMLYLPRGSGMFLRKILYRN